MRKDNGIKDGLSFLFRLQAIVIIVAQLISMLGILDVGNKVIHIIIQLLFLVFNVYFIVQAYRTVLSRLMEPITKIETAVKSMANGDLDVDISTDGNNELTVLANDFGQTVSKLRMIITDLTHIISEFAKGNFDVEVEHKEAFVGEYEVIYSELQDMVLVISDTMHHIDDVAGQVSDGSTELAKSSQDLAQNANEQAASIQKLLETVTEVTEQVIENTRTTDKAHDDANLIGEQTKISTAMMHELTDAMELIKETSNEIGKIIVDIEEIASETNLLSLNAAIEAARAGEAGKGFAVVADQIRTLAENSAASAVTTKELIDKSILEIQKGNEITEQTAEAMNRVIQEMDNIVMAVANIRIASDKQSVSVKSIEQGFESISSVVQNNSVSAMQTSTTCEELSSQAATLKELVSQFKLRSNET